MRILNLAITSSKPVSRFGSKSFSIAGLLVCKDAHVSTVHLGPAGLIGRHPAASLQLLTILTGDAVVSGDNGKDVSISPGQAALWQPGEHHETRTASGLVALVIEGQLDLRDQT